jgi:TRAP-type mannitol/chloroaromatic compound transport system substrate-binding protein
MTTSRRSFLTKGALAGAATLAAPTVVSAQAPIKWRMQTYAGAALGEQVVKPAVDAFNRIAQGQMEIELFYADQLVPTGELFQAMHRAPSTACSPMTTRWPRPPR